MTYTDFFLLFTLVDYRFIHLENLSPDLFLSLSSHNFQPGPIVFEQMWLKLIIFKSALLSPLQWLWDLFSSDRAQGQLRLCWVCQSFVDFPFHSESEETLKFYISTKGKKEG